MRNILKSTYIGKLLLADPLFGKGVILLLAIYTLVHIVRLEMYPLYMFAMFSKKEILHEQYSTYKIFVDDRLIDFRPLDDRHFTYLNNTIKSYDGIVSNGYVHPESKVIDKLFHKLSLSNSSLHNFYLKPHIYNKEKLNSTFGGWLKIFFNTKKSIKIIKENYSWVKKNPLFVNKSVLYEVD